MKKTIIGIAIVVIAMVSMTSCENKEKCWQAKITETYAYANAEDENELETDEREYWIWGTEEEVDAAIAAYKSSMEEYYKAKENFYKKYDEIFDAESEYKEGYIASYTVEKFKKVSEYDCKNGVHSHRAIDIAEETKEYKDDAEYYKEELKDLEDLE